MDKDNENAFARPTTGASLSPQKWRLENEEWVRRIARDVVDARRPSEAVTEERVREIAAEVAGTAWKEALKQIGPQIRARTVWATFTAWFCGTCGGVIFAWWLIS